jgi:hypothetical protein
MSIYGEPLGPPTAFFKSLPPLFLGPAFAYIFNRLLNVSCVVYKVVFFGVAKMCVLVLVKMWFFGVAENVLFGVAENVLSLRRFLFRFC